MTRRSPGVPAVVACLLAAWILGGAASARAQAPSPLVVETPGGEVIITADLMEQPGPNVLIARGNVELTRGTTRVLADRLEVNRDTGDAVALGRVIFYDGSDRLTGERIDYNFKTGTGVVHNGQARTAPYYRISGQVMERLDESRYVVRQGIFTTCDDDPPTWSFRFGTANADLEDIVYGTNASIWVKSLPVLPWFPILGAALRKERQTGFLFPTFGSSSRKGSFAEIPFFWAISDSQDLRVELDLYSKHGVGLTGEYRYVLSRSAGGTIRAFGIHETEQVDNQLNTPGATTPSSTSGSTALRKPDDRGWWGIQHNWNIAPGLSFKVDVNGVSDDLVLREYADNLYDRSRQSVQSNVFLTKTWPHANLVGNLFWYQDLTTLRPVELNRFPDVRLSMPRQPLPGLADVPGLSWLTYDLSAQFTKFVRDLGSDGSRLDVFPRLSLPLSVDGLFTITPFVAPRLTAFSKTATGSQVLGDGTVIETTRDEPIARRSIDIGADFEARASKIYNLGGFAGVDGLLHSIEPRATYTWRDGTNLDPALLPQWVTDNTPEASNIVFSLVNRLRARTVAPPGTDPHRWELLRFSLSSGYDFKPTTDRQVGPIRAELIVDPSRYFYFRGDTTYSIYKGEGFLAGNTDFVFTVPRFAASVGTRYTKASTNFVQGSTTFLPSGTNLLQGDTKFVQGTLRADLHRYVSANFSTAWDVRTDTFVENRFGLNFRFQCWALDFAYVSRAKEQGLTGSENEFRFAIYLLGVGGPFGVGQRFSSGGAAAVPGK
jgi:LPS-assembly protein